MTLPWTTSILYGVMMPRKLSDDCNDWQPARAPARTTRAAPRRAKDDVMGIVEGASRRSSTRGQGSYDGAILPARPCAPGSPDAHDQRRRTQEQRPQGDAAAHQGAGGLPE